MANDVDLVEKALKARQILEAEIRKRIVGHEAVVEQLLVALFGRGHAILVGVPGLAKTLLVRTLAEALDLSFGRIQFTPDLMPSDITGTDILEESGSGGRTFRFVKGPLFCQILLADEVNRTPPKTQAALLQAMQEGTVTVGGRTYPLAPPFHVFATQNPIEQEGTYPLPEAQLDRFMLEVIVEYPSQSEEAEIVNRTPGAVLPPVERVLRASDLLDIQELVDRVPVASHVVDFAVDLVRRTRPSSDDAPAQIKKFVTWGAGPRATQMLVTAAKARSVLNGRYAASVQDIEALAPPVLRHRLVTSFQAEAEGVKRDALVAFALEQTKKHLDR